MTTRLRRFALSALLGTTVALAAGACGEQQATDPKAYVPTSVTPAHTPPSDRSVPVVPGVKPSRTASQSADSGTRETTPDDVQTCGTAKGPDGALQIHLVAGDVTCDTARRVSAAFSPLMARGEPQQIQGWDCGQSTFVGELARCTKGSDAFALVP